MRSGRLERLQEHERHVASGTVADHGDPFGRVARRQMFPRRKSILGLCRMRVLGRQPVIRRENRGADVMGEHLGEPLAHAAVKCIAAAVKIEYRDVPPLLFGQDPCAGDAGSRLGGHAIDVVRP